MPKATLEAAIAWMMRNFPEDATICVSFHGGEPLLAGLEWYQYALHRLQACFAGRLEMHLQSNLWLLDDPFCELFKNFDVSIGSSLDGPE